MKCCDITAGKLREPIEFQRKTRTPDGAGGFTETWAAVAGAPTRAMVKGMSGGERWASHRLEATATHKIVVRYFDGLTEVDRAIIRNREYNIRWINNVEFADKFLEITAEVGVGV